MSRSFAGRRENARRVSLDDRTRGEEDRRVEVTLDGSVVADARPTFSQRGSPVEADHRTPRVALELEEGVRPGAEVDHGYPESKDPLEDVRDVGHHILAVVLARKL